MANCVPLACLLTALCATPLCAQPRAVLADGSGPWSDAQWAFTATQFSALLGDAGYSVKIVSPVDLAAALDSPNILVAVPSLESLPFECFAAIATHVSSGGSLMASGGRAVPQPAVSHARRPLARLRRLPSGSWIASAAGTLRRPTDPDDLSGQRAIPRKFRCPCAGGAQPGNLFFFVFVRALPRHRGPLVARRHAVRQHHFLLFPDQSPFSTAHSLVVWLPWPQIPDPLRAQLITALKAAPNRLYLNTAGADQIVWLPGEAITGRATILNASASPVQASLKWSISGPSGVIAQPAVALNLTAGELRDVPINIASLPNGDYTLNFRLIIENLEVDRVDSPVRVLNPILSRQPDQKIRIVNGAFSAGGRHVFLRGVNYWPRFIAGTDPARLQRTQLARCRPVRSGSDRGRSHRNRRAPFQSGQHSIQRLSRLVGAGRARARSTSWNAAGIMASGSRFPCAPRLRMLRMPDRSRPLWNRIYRPPIFPATIACSLTSCYGSR